MRQSWYTDFFRLQYREMICIRSVGISTRTLIPATVVMDAVGVGPLAEPDLPMTMPTFILRPPSEWVSSRRMFNAVLCSQEPSKLKRSQPCQLLPRGDSQFCSQLNRFHTPHDRIPGLRQVRPSRIERVLFHILNGSAGEIRSLALPGHNFSVIAMDGNPLPKPVRVSGLWLGTAERISAIVEMNHPGVWIMGDLADDDRGHGMGIVVEYAGHKGKGLWTPPKPFHWTYERFAKRNGIPATPNEV